jgi:hypothetical protein
MACPVPQGGRPAFRGVDGVVDLGADGGGAASREPAVLVACVEVTTHAGGDPVRVDGDGGAGERSKKLRSMIPSSPVRVRAVPGVDRRPAREAAGTGVGAVARAGGDEHLHAGADRTQGAGARVDGLVQARCARQQQVGEHVGAHLIGVPPVRRHDTARAVPGGVLTGRAFGAVSMTARACWVSRSWIRSAITVGRVAIRSLIPLRPRTTTTRRPAAASS